MSNQRENPSDFRTRCLRDERYCRKNIEDRTTRDDIARQAWYEKFLWLKKNAWWTFRNLQHWIRDYDYRYGDAEVLVYYDENGMYAEHETENKAWVPWWFVYNHRSHRWGGGCQDESLRLDAPKAHPERKEGRT